jgi:phosphohistidine phosphatase
VPPSYSNRGKCQAVIIGQIGADRLDSGVKLFLLRHAPAEPLGSDRLATDEKRALTLEGMDKMRQAAAGMKAFGLKFEVILSSPYLRARQTAEIAAKALRLSKRLQFTVNLAVGAKSVALVSEIQLRHPSASTVLLVGHEPFLSHLASWLLSGRETLGIHFRKGGLMCLEIERIKPGQCAILEWFMTPGQMVRMGKRDASRRG